MIKSFIFIAALLVSLLVVFSTDAYALKATATSIGYDGIPKGTISADITGLKKPPKNMFSIKILNGKKYKQLFYTTLTCTIQPDIKPIILSATTKLIVVNYNKDKIAVGLYEGGRISYPMSNIKVVVTNGDIKGRWNSLHCLIK